MYAGNTSDEILWQAFKDGDKAAYACIYIHYFHILFSYGKKITPSEDLIQDCIQDLFIEMLKNRQNLGHTDSIKYYLFKSLRRKINNALIKQGFHQRKYELIKDDADEAYQHTLTNSPEEEIITEQICTEQKQEILKALDLLTKSQKKAIQLKFYHNLSYPEIATAMSIHVDSVYNLISKATSLLKKNVKKVYILISLLLVQ